MIECKIFVGENEQDFYTNFYRSENEMNVALMKNYVKIEFNDEFYLLIPQHQIYKIRATFRG